MKKQITLHKLYRDITHTLFALSLLLAWLYKDVILLLGDVVV